MTDFFSARRAIAALAAISVLLLAACGGGGGSSSGGSSRVRMLNLMADVPSIDGYVETSQRFTAVAADRITDYSGLDVGSYNLKPTAAGSTTSLLAAAFTFSPAKDKSYTAVVSGRNGAARIVTLLEDEDTSGVAATTSRVRIYNASADAGALDVYISNAADLSSVSPNFSTVVTGTPTGFRDVDAGTYRLRITGAGDVNDVRLDVAGLVLGSKQAATLVLSSAGGSVLVDATKVLQGDVVTSLKNTQARIRVAAGVQAAGVVSTTIGGTALGANLRSPNVGGYAAVTAGSQALQVKVNGTTVFTGTQALTPGADYTVLVYGSAAAAQVQVLADDNRLATVGRFRVRLINADATVDSAYLQIGLDVPTGLENVTSGTSSVWSTATARTTAQNIEILSSSVDSIFTDSQILTSQSVYTAFVLGGKTSAATGLPLPTGLVRQDR